MNIAVCVSHVPDTATKIKIGSDNLSIDPAGVSYIINPYDEFAIEEALKLKEKTNGTVYVISVGNDQVKETIRKSLAMGADEGVHLKTDDNFDSISLGKLLADEIKNLNCEIAFFGKQSVDFDNGTTGIIAADYLGYNCISVCVSLNINGNEVTAEREIEGGREVVSSSLPIVITAQKGLNEPRYASLKGIMAAKKKTIHEKPVSISENYVKVHSLHKPKEKGQGRILGTDSNAVPELIKVLKDEIKII